MQTIQTILSNEVVQVALVTWIIQVVLTPLAAKLPKKGWLWAIIRGLHGLFDRIDPKQEQSARVDAAKATMGSLLVVLLLSCSGPAKAPTALDAAKAAIVLTDDALSVAITTADDETAKKLIDLVPKVELAARAVRISADACPTLPGLSEAAAALKCDKCTVAIELARKELSCP